MAVGIERAAGGGGLSGRFKAICRMCHGGCGTVVEMVGGAVRRVLGDPDNPVSKGLLCSKAGAASVEQLYHPDRLDHPLIRAGPRGSGKWRRAGWDEALALIAAKMRETERAFGAEAVAFGRGTGVNNTHIVSRLANLFGTPNVISIGYFCYGPRVAVCKVTAGGRHTGASWDTVAVPDFYSGPACIVEWGSQKRTSNDHGLIGHKPMTDALRNARPPVNVVVDPRMPASAGPGDVWLPLRPGTDAAMALGWMRVMVDEGLYDRDFVDKWCHGFDGLRRRLRDWPLARVAETTWCDAETIARAARIYAATRPGCIVWGNGTDQLGVNTFQATRSLLILMALSGNLDVPGGNVFWPAPRLAYPEAWDRLPPGQDAKRLGGDRFKALNMTPYAYAHPPSLFRAILTGEPYPVKTLVVVGNNTVTCFPNSRKIVEALKKLDFLVVQDLFMTPTAALADVVLPAAGNLERDEPRLHLHIKGPGGTLMDNVSEKLVEIGERRSDWEFIIGLGRALGFEDEFPDLEAFAEEALAPMGVSRAELREKDFVEVPLAYRKYEEMGFGTPTGKFEIHSTVMEEWGYDPLPDHVEPPESPVSTPERYRDYPLILNTGAKQPMYWHSQGRQLRSLRRLNPEPLVELHEDTAAALGIARGAYCWIETVRGRLRMKANPTRRTHPKVVSVPHGWWLPEAAAPDYGVFEVCSNVLTDDDPDNCDVALGSSPLKGLLCRVAPADPPETPRAALPDEVPEAAAGRAGRAGAP